MNTEKGDRKEDTWEARKDTCDWHMQFAVAVYAGWVTLRTYKTARMSYVYEVTHHPTCST